MARVDAATGLKPAYSFDQLVIGPNNHVAAGACQEVIKKPGETYNPLFIYGPAGVGKTHLMQAVAHEMLGKEPGSKVKYLSAERFINEIVTAISEDRVMEVRRAYSALDLLILDDVQYLIESKIAQEELFHIFNNMHEAGRQVILAADRPPNQLTNLNKGVRSRLEWGLATDVQVPDENTRLEILKKKESTQGLDIPDDLLVLVARSLKSNVRELEGFLKRMHAYVTLSHQSVSRELVQTVIQELNPENAEDMPATAPHRAPVKESPAPAKAAHDPTGISSEVSKILGGDNGHKNGHAKPAEKKPEPPPAPKSDTLDEILKAIDRGAAAAQAKPEAPAAPKPPAPPVEKAPEPPAAPKAAPPPVQKAPEPVLAAPAANFIPEVPDLPVDAPLFDDNSDPATAGHKEVTAVFFYPEGSGDAFETVHKKFQDVIKKHKLKFRLKRVHSEAYACKGKINYSNFVTACKDKAVPVAIVIGPPPDTLISEQDFYDLLTVALDVQGVSLQLVNWGEINKDYRYLNLALDIALVKSR